MKMLVLFFQKLGGQFFIFIPPLLKKKLEFVVFLKIDLLEDPKSTTIIKIKFPIPTLVYCSRF